MDRGRVGEDRGSKETDRCPLTDKASHCRYYMIAVNKPSGGRHAAV
jgi:hypothetical protein